MKDLAQHAVVDSGPVADAHEENLQDLAVADLLAEAAEAVAVRSRAEDG